MKRYLLYTTLAILTATIPVFGAQAPSSGFRAEFLKQMDEVSGKLIELAQAVPAEKYSWRPGKGVRSVSEVYVHVASANYLLLRFIGIDPPPEYTNDMEQTITEKPQVIEAMKRSFDFVRQAVLRTPDSDLDKSVELFGQNTTYRDVFFTMAMHMHEHLGQSIAYARINGIVPPWSAREK
jgi:uncharacterized damage-inducible protein DinB